MTVSFTFKAAGRRSGFLFADFLLLLQNDLDQAPVLLYHLVELIDLHLMLRHYLPVLLIDSCHLCDFVDQFDLLLHVFGRFKLQLLCSHPVIVLGAQSKADGLVFLHLGHVVVPALLLVTECRPHLAKYLHELLRGLVRVFGSY